MFQSIIFDFCKIALKFRQQMQIFSLHAVLTCLVSSCLVIVGEYIKPNFIPYCTTRDKCKPACSCELDEECKVIELDDTARKNILTYHNQLRDIQSAGEPIPGGMTMLQYDENLEEISKCWAARCENQYSECFTTPKFNETSQAVAQVAKTDLATPQFAEVLEIMNTWLGQAKSISAETLSDFPAGEEGENLHDFAQLLSDRILYVGCAWSSSKENITFVCSYGPRGPMQGEPIYKIGRLCSLCPEGYACDYVKPFTRLCKEIPRLSSTGTIPPQPPPVPPMPLVTPPQLPPEPPKQTRKIIITAPPEPPPFQIVPNPITPGPPPSMPSRPPAVPVLAPVEPIPLPVEPRTTCFIPSPPPRPPQVPPSPPRPPQVPPSPPRPLQVPPSPPPRQLHICPPPIPPRAPHMFTHPTYSIGNQPPHLVKIPPFLHKTTPVPCHVRERLVELPSTFSRMSGGVFESPSYLSPSRTFSECYYPPQPPPLPHVVPTPPPLPRIIEHQPQTPFRLPPLQFQPEPPPPLPLIPLESSEKHVFTTKIAKESFNRPPVLPDPPGEPPTRPPLLHNPSHKIFPHQFAQTVPPPRIPPYQGFY